MVAKSCSLISKTKIYYEQNQIFFNLNGPHYISKGTIDCKYYHIGNIRNDEFSDTNYFLIEYLKDWYKW